MASSRRQFAKTALAAAAALSLSSLVKASPKTPKQKIVCVGGHPDDPESGCGGTLALLAAAGHEVSIIYLTRGEAGIRGKSHSEAAAIRSGEAEAACKILGAKPLFAGQVDGESLVSNDWVARMDNLLQQEKPALVFSHWPLDSHKDHQVAGLLTYQCWIRSGRAFDLYLFEVCTGSQTMGFKPTYYVDITATRDTKRKAVYCHQSQNPPGIYAAPDCNHALMETFRGIEMNVGAAEAFVKMERPGTFS